MSESAEKQVRESIKDALLEYEPNSRNRPADVAAAIMGALERYSIVCERPGQVPLRDLLFRLRKQEDDRIRSV